MSGDGYLRARLAGAIDANIDWPNSGTRCEGESRDKPPGVRLSFQRVAGGRPDLLLVFGLTGVRAGKPAHEVGANLTIIVQGKSRIFGTLGDTRCTVDSLTQRRLTGAGAYRVEAQSAQSDILAQLADGTGGTFFHNRNDVDAGLRQAVAAPQLSYLLGFSPQNMKIDGRYHTLKVSLTNKQKFAVQARHGIALQED